LVGIVNVLHDSFDTTIDFHLLVIFSTVINSLYTRS